MKVASRQDLRLSSRLWNNHILYGKQAERPTKGKVIKSLPKNIKVTKTPPQSSSSSELEQNEDFSPILTKKILRTSLPPQNSPRTTTKTLRKSVQNVTPNRPVPRSESSSEERLRSPKSSEDFALTPEQIVEEAKNISPCVTMSRGKDNARKEMKKKLDEGTYRIWYFQKNETCSLNDLEKLFHFNIFTIAIIQYFCKREQK